MRGQGAQLVVLLSHMGVLFDRALDQPGVDVIVGGHSHTLLSNTEPGAFAPDAQPDPGGALVLQAGAYGRYLGRLDLDLAADGTVLAHGGGCVHVGLDGPEDLAVAGIVARFAAPLQAFRQEIVATLPEALSLSTCRFTQCELGQTVATAMLTATHGAEVAIMNAGGLRTGLPAGPVNRGQVLEAMPFGNTIATLTLSGADLEAALRHGLSQLGRGGFPQWAGLRFVGVGFEVRRGEGWAPLDPAERYLVVTNNFLRNGGDGYSVFRDRGADPYDNGPGLMTCSLPRWRGETQRSSGAGDAGLEHVQRVERTVLPVRRQHDRAAAVLLDRTGDHQVVRQAEALDCDARQRVGTARDLGPAAFDEGHGDVGVAKDGLAATKEPAELDQRA